MLNNQNVGSDRNIRNIQSELELSVYNPIPVPIRPEGAYSNIFRAYLTYPVYLTAGTVAQKPVAYKWKEVYPYSVNVVGSVVDMVWNETGRTSEDGNWAYPTGQFSVGRDPATSTLADPKQIVTIESVGTLSGMQYLIWPNDCPRGTVKMWSGAKTKVPYGYCLCDGTTVDGLVTPDLRSRFVVGYDDRSVDPGSYTGSDGASHDSPWDTLYGTIGNLGGFRRHGYDPAIGANINNHANHDTGTETEGDASTKTMLVPENTSPYIDHTLTDNRPSWYVLAFIIKL